MHFVGHRFPPKGLADWRSSEQVPRRFARALAAVKIA
jgi:hypothetical protein